ncbi:MAG: hypothetical protein HRU14_04045 [Planctomycetes bacterium]|nr:hypothetical protein [Planctomycetota bacterium]
MKRSLRLLPLIALPLFVFSSGLSAQVGQGLIDPNSATEKQLVALDGMTDAIVAKLVKARPFASAVELDAFLGKEGLEAEARKKLYGKAFLHINLNTAKSKEIRLIPGVGRRMAHEFDEYRPWKSFKQFDKEIGKYVSKEEVARLKKYCFIPLDLNKASDADFRTIPGVGKRMAHEFEEYRPWKSKKQFEREIGKYVNEKEVARFWRYMTIK